jgi:hypothetical protein
MASIDVVAWTAAFSQLGTLFASRMASFLYSARVCLQLRRADGTSDGTGPYASAAMLASRVGGEILERLGQLVLVGEIAAGIVLGPSVLGIITPSPELKVLSDLGVFLLVMLAGMEMQIRDIKESLRGRGTLIAGRGFLRVGATSNRNQRRGVYA